MKKLLLGITFLLSGFIGILSIVILRSVYPYSYESNLGDFIGFLIDSHTIYIFLLSLIMFLIGVCISFKQSYKNDFTKTHDNVVK